MQPSNEVVEYLGVAFDNYCGRWTVPVKSSGPDDSIDMSLWDTAGQEEYDRLLPLSYRGTDIFLLVFDSDLDKEAKKAREGWAGQLNFHEPNGWIVLVRVLRYYHSFPASERQRCMQVAREIGACGLFDVVLQIPDDWSGQNCTDSGIEQLKSALAVLGSLRAAGAPKPVVL